MKGKVIGIGGVFIKFKDPEAMNKWYEEVLGLKGNGYGVLFAFNTPNETVGYLQLGTFVDSSDYFGESGQQYMMNFRVDNMDAILEKLKESGTPILNEVSEYEYGKFLHIQDPEGNRIELWEPLDRVFDQEKQVKMQ